jgi:hypothetical protein
MPAARAGSQRGIAKNIGARPVTHAIRYHWPVVIDLPSLAITAQRETLPIAGFALKDKKFDGIYVGRRKGDDLVYAGKVDLGFDKPRPAICRKS